MKQNIIILIYACIIISLKIIQYILFLQSIKINIFLSLNWQSLQFKSIIKKFRSLFDGLAKYHANIWKHEERRKIEKKVGKIH